MFNMIYYYPITCFIPNLSFLTISFGNCQNLQWWLGDVWFLRTKALSEITPRATNIVISPEVTLIHPSSCHLVKAKRTHNVQQQ